MPHSPLPSVHLAASDEIAPATIIPPRKKDPGMVSVPLSPIAPGVVEDAAEPKRRVSLKSPTRRGSDAYHTAGKISDFYTIAGGKPIGKGGFGEVRYGTRKSDGKIVAVKIISKLKFAEEQDHTDMMTEVDLMLRVRGHRNVVEMYDYFEDRAGFWIVCELCTGGELMERIVKSTTFSESVASRYFRQMLEGLQWCHEHNVVHRDLKPENFLLSSPDPDAELKISDFGLSCFIEHQDSIITDACGSAYYIAPEIFSRRYTKAADVWALGVNLYLLLSGSIPFGVNAETEAEVYRAIQTEPLTFGSAWRTVSAAARELVTGLLEKDPYKRYTLKQAIAHPWVSGGAAVDTPLDPSLVTALLAFNAKNRFKKDALKLVASTLSANDVAAMRAAFNKIDTDQSGVITFTEMAAALRSMGITNVDEIERLMRNLDSDGDGTISWEEFLQASSEQQMIHHQNNIWWAFCEYDKDGDGKISVEELRLALKDEPEEVVKAYIREFDSDGDGTISYEEFIRMLLPKTLNFKLAAAVPAPEPARAAQTSPVARSASNGVTLVRPAPSR